MKKILSIILLALFICGAFTPAFTSAENPFQEYTSGDYRYYKMPSVYNPGEYYAVITQYRGSSSTLVIPEKLDGMYVTGFQTGTFKNNTKLKSITLPARISQIPPSCFQGCSKLQTVKFTEPSSVGEIREKAFYGCTALKSITLETSLRYIGDSAFYNCTSLSRIYMKSYSLERVGKNIFANAGKNCSDTVFVTSDSSVQYIPVDMFNCPLSTPAYINRAFISSSYNPCIGKNAFKNCVALTDNYVPFPNSTEISDHPWGSKNTLGVPGTTVVHTYNGTFVENYLKKYGYSYELLNSDAEIPVPVMTLSSIASSGKTRISWDYDGMGKIQVYRSETKTGGYKRLTTTYAFNSSYTDKTAEAGKTYYYKIRLVDGKFCAPKYRTCKLPRPVVSAKVTGGKIKLTWDAIDGAVSYKVYRSTEKDGSYKLIKTTTNTSFINSSVQKGVTYYYKVRAVCSNTNGNSAYSEVVSAKVS